MRCLGSLRASLPGEGKEAERTMRFLADSTHS
jgi:hypothetical protein